MHIIEFDLFTKVNSYSEQCTDLNRSFPDVFSSCPIRTFNTSYKTVWQHLGFYGLVFSLDVQRKHKCLVRFLDVGEQAVGWIRASAGSRPCRKPSAVTMNRGSVCSGSIHLHWPFSKQTAKKHRVIRNSKWASRKVTRRRKYKQEKFPGYIVRI